MFYFSQPLNSISPSSLNSLLMQLILDHSKEMAGQILSIIQKKSVRQNCRLMDWPWPCSIKYNDAKSNRTVRIACSTTGAIKAQQRSLYPLCQIVLKQQSCFRLFACCPRRSLCCNTFSYPCLNTSSGYNQKQPHFLNSQNLLRHIPLLPRVPVAGQAFKFSAIFSWLSTGLRAIQIPDYKWFYSLRQAAKSGQVEQGK